MDVWIIAVRYNSTTPRDGRAIENVFLPLSLYLSLSLSSSSLASCTDPTMQHLLFISLSREREEKSTSGLIRSADRRS